MGSLADTTILSWITAEVDQALERVRQTIAKFESAPGDANAASPGSTVRLRISRRSW